MRYVLSLLIVALGAGCRGTLPTAPAQGDRAVDSFRALRRDQASLVADAADADGLVRTQAVPPGDGTEWVETRGGASLCGLRYEFGDYSGHQVISGVAPIFRTADVDEHGPSHGTGVGQGEVRAQGGYAVGGLVVRSGDMLDGFMVVFYRERGTSLDPGDSYASPWIGGDGGVREVALGGDGRRIVGLWGAEDDWLRSLGLVLR